MDYSLAIASLKQADSTLVALIEQIGSCQLDRKQQAGNLLLALSESIFSVKVGNI
jgi:hypothetical protein